MSRRIAVAAVAGALALGGALLFLFKPAPVADASLESFAQCLAGRGAVMYGAAWCPHCQSEKRAFGRAFSSVPYVECPADPRRCLAEGITGYPTWVFADGRRFVGEQGIGGLAAASGCPLTAAVK